VRQRLILMCKYPRPGAVKTRLGPALGMDRACDLHRALVAHTVAEMTRFAAQGGDGVCLEARVADAPDEASARAWLGAGLSIRPQGDGDLGQRMARAVESAIDDGVEAVVVIGGDCPELTATQLGMAFAALVQKDLVLGPASDGGYYLIGLQRACPALFAGIAWGGPEVRAQTLAIARERALAVTLLAELSDVDVPADLALWARTPAARTTGRGGISVIIPTLNEAAILETTLEAVRLGNPHEMMVVDGGSHDRTAEVARAAGAIYLSTNRGRAAQMNFGAAAATGEFLLFLHADTLLPSDYPSQVRSTLVSPGVAGGAFGFAIADDFPGRKLIEWGTNRRARRGQLPYGDQGLFVTRAVFERVGGFPDQPIMEDYEFVQRLRHCGTIVIARNFARTSGRRWQRRGAIGTTLLNQLIVLGYRCGISPARLARWYRGE
jgi:rSAM/selenodomain-associated transferase 2/rSAM/selenodomain-associated transferase 1